MDALLDVAKEKLGNLAELHVLSSPAFAASTIFGIHRKNVILYFEMG
jgi:hypothetical protein